MLIQGSNNPLTIKLDQQASGLAALAVSLWETGAQHRPAMKVWTLDDVTISGDTIVCPLTEAETRAVNGVSVTLEVKGLDGSGNTLFWASVDIPVLHRHDKIITLTRVGG